MELEIELGKNSKKMFVLICFNLTLGLCTVIGSIRCDNIMQICCTTIIDVALLINLHSKFI